MRFSDGWDFSNHVLEYCEKITNNSLEVGKPPQGKKSGRRCISESCNNKPRKGRDYCRKCSCQDCGIIPEELRTGFCRECNVSNIQRWGKPKQQANVKQGFKPYRSNKYGKGKKKWSRINPKNKDATDRHSKKFVEGTSKRKTSTHVGKNKFGDNRIPRKCYGIHPHCSICGQCHTNRRTHDKGHPRR